MRDESRPLLEDDDRGRPNTRDKDEVEHHVPNYARLQQNSLFRSDSPHNSWKHIDTRSHGDSSRMRDHSRHERERTRDGLRDGDRERERGGDFGEDQNRYEHFTPTKELSKDRAASRYRERSRHTERYRDRSMGRDSSVGSLFQRRHSQSDLRYERRKPLFRLISSHYTVTNPQSTDYTSSTQNLLLPQLTGELDLEEEQRRLSILNIKRPQKLIGKFIPLCNWNDFFKDTSDIKSKSVRKYYEDQNFLIEKFNEIDNFLDAGKIHYNMLRNYNDENNLHTLNEDDKDSENENHQNYSYNAIDDDSDVNDDMNQINGTTLKPNFDGSNGDLVDNADNPAKFSRFHITPGNIDNDGAKLLGVDEEQENADVVFAILVNFFINIVLLIGKIVVALLTDSISVIASLVDSILDFLSTFIIFIANKLSTKEDWKTQRAYPVGRSRLEPLGILIFSVIIIISFFQVGQESFKRLFFPKEKSIANIGWDAIAIMSVTIVAKIGCWVWCKNSKSSSIQALAQDAETDIVFNTVSLLMPTLGHIFEIWWLDPLGALLLSVYIIISWAYTAYEHIDKLTGAVADTLDYKVILYLAYRFAEPIQNVTALKVYHFGDKYLVEIDIVFGITEFDLSFKDCHDLAEALQYAIETLPMVERAFVHIDYMEGNFKGHLK